MHSINSLLTYSPSFVAQPEVVSLETPSSFIEQDVFTLNTQSCLFDVIEKSYYLAMNHMHLSVKFSQTQEVFSKIQSSFFDHLPFEKIRYLSIMTFNTANIALQMKKKREACVASLFAMRLLLRAKENYYSRDPLFEPTDLENIFFMFDFAISNDAEEANKDEKIIEMIRDYIEVVSSEKAPESLEASKRKIQFFLQNHKRKLDSETPSRKKLRSDLGDSGSSNIYPIQANNNHTIPLKTIPVSNKDQERGVNDYKINSPTKAQLIKLKQQKILEGLNHLISNNHSNSLKPYQLEALRQCSTFIQSGKRIGYFYLPGGEEKTYLMSLTLLAIKIPTLIILPTYSLVEQTIKAIQKLSPQAFVSELTENSQQQLFDGQILVTTDRFLQNKSTFINLKDILKNFGLIWIEGAQHRLSLKNSDLIKFLQKSAFVFGVTSNESYNSYAESKSFDKLEELFFKKIYEVNLETLIELKQLAPVKTILVHTPPLKEIKSIKSKALDYIDAELEKEINDNQLNEIIGDIYFNEYDPHTQEKIFGQPALVFCAGAAHATAVCTLLNKRKDLPYRHHPLAAYLTAETSAENRKKIIELHQQGRIPILVRDNAFTQEFDFSPARLGFFLRPTKSMVFAEQNRGYLMRPFKDKEKALIFEWVYPGLKQFLFKDLINGKAWCGIDAPKYPFLQRITNNYFIEWYPPADLAKNRVKPFSKPTPLSNSLNPVNSESFSTNQIVPFIPSLTTQVSAQQPITQALDTQASPVNLQQKNITTLYNPSLYSTASFNSSHSLQTFYGAREAQLLFKQSLKTQFPDRQPDQLPLRKEIQYSTNHRLRAEISRFSSAQKNIFFLSTLPSNTGSFS